MKEDNIEEVPPSESESEVQPERVDSLTVVGAGTMGREIAVLAARHGVEVFLVEKNEQILNHSIKEISDNLDREIARWAMTESEKKAILSRIKGVVDFSELSDQNYVIEAVSENLELKKDVFRELDRVCNPEAIFITNTSTLSITELGSATERSDRVIGMHFLNPGPKGNLIEIVKGLNTSSSTFHKAISLANKLERTAIEVFEAPGYVTTRVMMPMVNTAIEVLMEGIASAEDIDTALRLGYDLNRGPLAMADSIGLDQVLNWLETLFHDLGDVKYRPCPMLRMLVRAGHLGIKTGKGFYRYDGEGRIIEGSGHTAAAYERFLK